MTAASFPSSPRWSIPAFVVGSLAVIAFLVALNPPVYRPSDIEPRTARAEGALQGGADTPPTSEALDASKLAVVPVLPTIAPPAHRANRVLMLQVGPDERYLTVGQVARGARVDVVGRNEKGDWLAVSLTLGAKSYGWVPAAGVSGLSATAISELPVKPVVRLP